MDHVDVTEQGGWFRNKEIFCAVFRRIRLHSSSLATEEISLVFALLAGRFVGSILCVDDAGGHIFRNLINTDCLKCQSLYVSLFFTTQPHPVT